jgi:hypothetical protein
MKLISLLLLILTIGPLAKAQDTTAEVFASEKRIHGNQIHLFGDFGFTQYNINANANVDANTRSMAFGMEAFWNLNPDLKIFLSQENLQQEIKTSAGSSPPSVKSERRKSKIALTSSKGNTQYGLGYFLIDRSGEHSSPFDLISDHTKSGVLFTLDYSSKRSSYFYSRLALQLGLITTFQENSATTGSYQSGFIFDSKYLLSYPLSKSLDLAFGAYFQLERTQFKGTGDRGLRDALEQSMNYGIPLELSFYFE